MGCRLIQADTAAGTAHSNSTTEASVGRMIFTPGHLQPGKIYDIEAIIRATTTNSTDTGLLAVRWGTSTTVTSNTAVASSGAIDEADNDIGLVRARLHIQTATRAVLTVQLNDPDAEGTTSMEPYIEILALAADTTYYFDVTFDWSAASSSDSVQTEAFAVLEITF